MVQKKIEMVVTAAPDQAVSGFEKIRRKIEQTNQKIREMNILSRGPRDLTATIGKVGEAQKRMVTIPKYDANKGLSKLNKDVSDGTKNLSHYNKEVDTFNKGVKDMSTLSNIGSREVRKITNEFNRFTAGARAFEQFKPRLEFGRGERGWLTGERWFGFQHRESGGVIPRSPKFMLPQNDNLTRQMVEEDFIKLSLHMEQFGKNLEGMNKEALDVSRVFGDTTLVTSRFKDVLDAFVKPDMINIEKMSKGPFAGMYQLKGAGGRAIPGTPEFDTEEEAQRFVTVVGNMREGMEKTTKQQEQMNRRQGISFGNLLALMVKFGIAMQMIEFPGKVLEEYNRILSKGENIQHSIAQTSTLVAEMMGDKPQQEAYRRALTDIAINRKVQGEDPTFILAELGKVLASDIETVPRMAAQKISGYEFGPEVSTLLNLIDITSKLAPAALTESPLTLAPSVSKISGGFKVPLDKMDPYLNTLLTTIDIGAVTAEQLNAFVGEAVGFVSTIWGHEDPETIYKRFNEVMANYATMTTTISPEYAATAFRNIFGTIIKPPAALRKDILGLRDVTAARPDMDTIDLTVGGLVSGGFENWMQTYISAVGPEGILTDLYLKSPKGKKDLALALTESGGDAATAERIVRQTQSTTYAGYIMPGLRGFRGLQTLLIGAGEKHERLAFGYEGPGGEEVIGFYRASEQDQVDKKFLAATDTIQSTQAMRGALKESIELDFINLEKKQIREEHISRRETDIRNMDRGWRKNVTTFFHRLNPFSYSQIPLPYEPSSDVNAFIRMLGTGATPEEIVAPEGVWRQEYKTGLPPGLTPGGNIVGNYMKFISDYMGQHPSSKIALTDKLRFLEDYEKGYVQSLTSNKLDLLLADPYANMSANPGLSSPTGRELGELSSAVHTINTGDHISVGDIHVNVTMEGGGGTEEDGDAIANRVVEAMVGIFDLESYANSPLTTLHRNVGADSIA